jgi:hypothetical protein
VSWQTGAMDEGKLNSALGPTVYGRRRSVYVRRWEPRNDSVDGGAWGLLRGRAKAPGLRT